MLQLTHLKEHKHAVCKSHNQKRSILKNHSASSNRMTHLELDIPKLNDGSNLHYSNPRSTHNERYQVRATDSIYNLHFMDTTSRDY